MDKLRRAVVASEGDDGAVLYEYGWVIEVEMTYDCDEVRWWGGQVRTHERISTTVRWAHPPKRSATYPTDADFAGQIGGTSASIAAGHGSWPAAIEA